LIIFLYLFFSQLSPGELHESHKHLEGMKNCIVCHEVGTKSFKNKCLECHELLKERITQKKGYHGLMEDPACEKCHSDHHGRTFEMVHWKDGMEKFNHKETGFDLLGSHAKEKCNSCHKEAFQVDVELLKTRGKHLSQTFFGLSSACSACHLDEHRKQLGSQCQNCHDEIDWKKATKFDHQKTEFAIGGSHQKVACEKCHRKERDEASFFVKYKGYEFQRCESCHSDVHKGQFDQDCSSCHDEKSWAKVPRFNHDLTSYRLTGAHAKAMCSGCHKEKKGTVQFKGLKVNKCQDCHDDSHEGRLGADCGKCHDTSSWRKYNTAQFDHAQTRYPLKGLHRQVSCDKCHQPRKKTISYDRCGSCHRDVHMGELDHFGKGQCSTCHDENGFLPARFTVKDHNKSDFQLGGAHLATPCSSCHNKTNSDKWPYFSQSFKFKTKHCSGCHKSPHVDETFERLLASQGDPAFQEDISRSNKDHLQLQKDLVGDCNGCHVDEAWSEISFNHTRQTKFELTGQHLKTPCSKCHWEDTHGDTKSESLIFTPLKMNCQSCHKDPHLSQFQDKKCESCHVTTDWYAEKFDHSSARFKLDGAHSGIACNKCHQQMQIGEAVIQYVPIPHRCEDCH